MSGDEPDRAAVDAADEDALVRHVLSLGGTPEQIEGARGNLGDLALDLTLRPDRPFTLGEVAAEAGIDWRAAERLVTAIGLPADPDEPIDRGGGSGRRACSSP